MYVGIHVYVNGKLCIFTIQLYNYDMEQIVIICICLSNDFEYAQNKNMCLQY